MSEQDIVVPQGKKPRKLRRTIFLLPSLFTVGNIFAGFFAVIATFHGDFGKAAVAIGIAVILDGIDGRVARMTNASSDFGLQLDSLADVISFGIAPAILIYSWGFEGLGDLAGLSAFFFLICGAMRLARFNVQVQDLKQFAGMPIPAAAGMVAATVHLFQSPPQSDVYKLLLVAMTYLLGLLMISRIKYPSLKHLNPGRGKSHLNILLLGVVIAGIIWYSQQVLMVIAASYLLSGPVLRGYRLFKYRSREAEPVRVKQD